MRFERQKRPLLVIREGGLSLFGSHGKGTGPLVSHCIAMRECQTPVEVKNFQSQKNVQLFFKTGFVHVSGLRDNFKWKKNFRISDRISDQSGIAMRFERQKRPLLVIREGGLSLFGSHGKGTGPLVSHCIAMRECQTPVEVKNFQSQKNVQLFFKTGFVHVSGLWDNFKWKKISEFQTEFQTNPVSQ